MKWPRGRYNGKRIGGIRLDVEFNLTFWMLRFYFDLQPWSIHIGPLHVWITMAYEK